MKKFVIVITVFCLLFAAVVPVSAAEETEILHDAESKPYQTVYRWNRLCVDIDVAETDPDLFISDLKRSGLVDRVLSDETSFVYPGEQEPGTAYLSIHIGAPCEQNNAALRGLLAETPGIMAVYQPVLANLAGGDNVLSDLTRISVIVDGRQHDPAAVADDLRTTPHVHSVARQAGAEGSPYAVFVLFVEYPVEENCAAVLREVKQKDYVEYARIDALSEEALDLLSIETGPLEDLEAGYEVIHYWNRLCVDYDAAACDAERLTDAIMRSGFADEVQRLDGSAVYVGEVPDGIDGLRIFVRSPYRENNEKLVRLLEGFEGIRSVIHPVTGCGNRGEGDYFTFEWILTAVNLNRCDIQTALRELRDLPHVRSVESMKAEDDDFPIATFAVEVEAPAESFGPDVLRAVNRKEYVLSAQFERLAIGPESENTVFPYGDVNRDGQVGADDARAILRYSVRLEHPKDYLVQILADVDSSGSVTAADARLALRTAVGLNAKNYYTYSTPKYAGLIAGKSLELTRQGDRLLLTASTTGSNKVTKCGFTYVKLQKLVNGVWTDLKEYTYRDQFNSTNAKVFSVSIVVPKGYSYRAVCEHYAEAPYLQLFTQSASYYNATNAVTM